MLLVGVREEAEANKILGFLLSEQLVPSVHVVHLLMILRSNFIYLAFFKILVI